MPEPDKDEMLDDEFEVSVRRQRERIERAREETEGSVWRYLGLLGVVGWSVALPALLGALLGAWIDARAETGTRWTLGLLVLGLAVGCFNAWRMMTEER